jgi:hypothetical protein
MAVKTSETELTKRTKNWGANRAPDHRDRLWSSEHAERREEGLARRSGASIPDVGVCARAASWAGPRGTLDPGGIARRAQDSERGRARGRRASGVRRARAISCFFFLSFQLDRIGLAAIVVSRADGPARNSERDAISQAGSGAGDLGRLDPGGGDDPRPGDLFAPFFSIDRRSAQSDLIRGPATPASDVIPDPSRSPGTDLARSQNRTPTETSTRNQQHASSIAHSPQINLP